MQLFFLALDLDRYVHAPFSRMFHFSLSFMYTIAKKPALVTQVLAFLSKFTFARSVRRLAVGPLLLRAASAVKVPAIVQ